MITVHRVARANDGVFGVLLGENGLPYFVTLERTFQDRAPFDPVIPDGVYDAVPSYYHKGGYRTFEIKPVPGHSRLLFHTGNLEDDSLGCVLVGTSFGTLGGKQAILGSRVAFDRFMGIMPGHGFSVRFE